MLDVEPRLYVFVGAGRIFPVIANVPETKSLLFPSKNVPIPKLFVVLFQKRFDESELKVPAEKPAN